MSQRTHHLWNSYQKARTLLGAGSIAAFLIFWWAASGLRILPHPGTEALLIDGFEPVRGYVLTAVVFAACTLLGTALSGRVRYDGGVACACIGLAALAWKAAPAGAAIRRTGSVSSFTMFALELLLLAALIAAVWIILQQMSRQGRLGLRPDPERDGLVVKPEPLDQKFLALAIHVFTMVLVLLVLARSDERKQVMVAVLVAGFVGSLIAHRFIPAQPGAWFYGGPILCGLVGYLWAAVGASGAELGVVSGALAPVARPLPLDYASLGVAGAMIGYWHSRRALREKQKQPKTEPAPEITYSRG
jgi:hypothetical protein